MSIFRFLDNIPTVFFTMIWIGLLGAITLGARMVEKHFTNDNFKEGPDHKFSMNFSYGNVYVLSLIHI